MAIQKKQAKDDFALKIQNEEIILEQKDNRKVKFQDETKFDELNITPESIADLARFLNSPKGLHIHDVYFSREGKWHFNKYFYENKKVNYSGWYSRLEHEDVIDQATGKLGKLLINYEAREIVKTMTADEIIDLWWKWKDEQDKIEAQLVVKKK